LNSHGATSPQAIAVLISGRGSNMRALIDASLAAGSPYRVALVIADRAEAPGLEAARDLGVPTLCVPGPARAPAADPDARAQFEARLASAVDDSQAALLVLAGFMRILSASFVARYAGRILNIHPSLLPKYPGLDTHRRALAAGDPVHGATVHFVSAALDAGPAVLQARVPIRAGDDEPTLAARVLAVEHAIYPEAVRWYCDGRLRCRDCVAWLDGAVLTGPVLHQSGAD
jgi:phosphoribosylglycinamide formyltransferase-1